MKRDRIPINKDIIPYRFQIALPDEMYDIGIRYNSTADMFTASLRKNDELICAAEPLIYGMELFGAFSDALNYPPCKIIPLDESGSQGVITWDNMGSTVFLTIDNGGDDE